MDENTGFIEDLNVKNWQRLEKELGAKIDELGSLDLEFEHFNSPFSGTKSEVSVTRTEFAGNYLGVKI